MSGRKRTKWAQCCYGFLTHVGCLKFWERRYSPASIHTQREGDHELFFFAGLALFMLKTVIFVGSLFSAPSEYRFDSTCLLDRAAIYFTATLFSRMLMTPAVRRDGILRQMRPWLRRFLRLFFWRLP
jgi:hypothetical protein